MRKFEVVKDEFRVYKDATIKLPTRADDGSAGYDFYSPISFTIKPGETKFIHFDVKAAMEKDDVLFLFVRSSIGIKKKITLDNGTGVIDSTFYSNPDNDGNMCAAFTNHSSQTWSFEAGDRLIQGVFAKYLITDDDQAEGERLGGFGSTSK